MPSHYTTIAPKRILAEAGFTVLGLEEAETWGALVCWLCGAPLVQENKFPKPVHVAVPKMTVWPSDVFGHKVTKKKK